MHFQGAKCDHDPLWLSVLSWGWGLPVPMAFLKVVFFFELCSTGFDMIEKPGTPARMR